MTDKPEVAMTLPGGEPLIRLSDYQRLQAEYEKLRKGLNAVQDLIDSSYGVAGLHLNGEIAPWSDLLEGGIFEAWLAEFDAAMQEVRKP